MWTLFWRALLALTVIAVAMTPAAAHAMTCGEEVFGGRLVRICPDAPAVDGLMVDSVFIDGVPLALLVRDGRFTTALNQYLSHATLRDAAHDAVAVLAGAKLASLEEQAAQSDELKEKIEKIVRPCE